MSKSNSPDYVGNPRPMASEVAEHRVDPSPLARSKAYARELAAQARKRASVKTYQLLKTLSGRRAESECEDTSQDADNDRSRGEDYGGASSPSMKTPDSGSPPLKGVTPRSALALQLEQLDMEAARIAERRAALFSQALGTKEALGEVPTPDSVTFCILEGCDVPVANAEGSACCDQHLMLHSVISSAEVPGVPVSDAVTLCVLEGCANPVPNVSEQACCASHLKLHGYMMLQASDSANSDAQSRPNAPLGTVSVRVRSGGKTPVTPGPLKQPEPHAGAGKQKRQGNELASKGLA